MLALEGLIMPCEQTEYDYGLGTFGGRRMVSARSSFNLTGSGGICFISSGTSFILQIKRNQQGFYLGKKNSFHPNYISLN